MKFGHTFQEHLEQDGFPSHWIASAISYRQLKKCIKRVEKELAELGLDAATLSQLLRAAEKSRSGHGVERERYVEYTLSERNEGDVVEVPFQPKLLIAVDKESGEPLDATLSPKTRDYLHQLALKQHLTRLEISDLGDKSSTIRHDSASTTEGNASHDTTSLDSEDPTGVRPFHMIEVPLVSDSEFFGMLQAQLNALASLQAHEQAKLEAEVKDLSKVITRVTEPNRMSSKSDLAAWRKVFEMYLESRIFFSTNELEHGRHDSSKAQALLQKFADDAKQETAVGTRFRKKESAVALERFLSLNGVLVTTLRFQEINAVAMRKILKKFDKHSGLPVRTTFPAFAQTPGLSTSIAKAVCYQVSISLLPIVPQLDDYLCPVCFSISFRPIRLRCQHIFCIRCLVVLQRAHENHCPLCRGAVVMEADSQNLDPALANFLIKYFPDEVRAKQKENERAAGVDRYGESYNDRCTVM